MSAATYIGRTASAWLKLPAAGAVCGVTSRGIFIKLSGERVVFLSNETFRGPLTLNLSAGWGVLHRLALHSSAQIQPDGLFFPLINFLVSADAARIWEAAPPPKQILPREERQTRLEAVTRATIADYRSNMLDAVQVRRARLAIKNGETGNLAAALDACLGLGTGLTPSGDDFTLGVLLTLRRWGFRLALGVDLARISESILPAASRKTTTLAANLIGCAAQGQADERLVDALDGIMTGAPGVAACAVDLRSWGSSSGMDALAGMAAVLSAAA